ncbi:MAG: ATP-binding protein [Candidatus Hadarchaeales archaeon]
MENPFIYGTIVTGKHFVDREGEIRELKSDLLSGQHVVLYSPRKMGKSSLIEETFRRIGNNAVCVRINVQNATTKEGLARSMINEIVRKSYTSLEKLARETKEFFSRISVRAFVDAEGRIGVEPIFRERKELLEDALEFPERIGKKRKLIVAFDEFQEIERLDGIEMERVMRATMEKHRNVTYLFSGSERHLISLIFENKERPFYRFGKMVKLGPIERKELEKFVVEKFRETGKKIEEKAVNFIIDFSEGIPFYVQALCHEAWNIGGNVDIETARKAMGKIISSFSSGYDLIWRSIKSEYQRKVLVAMAVEDRSFAPNMELIEKYELKTAAHLRKAMDALQEKGLICQNRIEDFIFREWIKLTKVV